MSEIRLYELLRKTLQIAYSNHMRIPHGFGRAIKNTGKVRAMIDKISHMLRRQPDPSTDIDYLDSIGDLISYPLVRSMKNYIQNGDVDCLEHSLYVSYYSYLVCRRINLNYRCAARGGLLHDFFLYDWHIKGSHKGLHGLNHPRSALRNAKKVFCLWE